MRVTFFNDPFVFRSIRLKLAQSGDGYCTVIFWFFKNSRERQQQCTTRVKKERERRRQKIKAGDRVGLLAKWANKREVLGLGTTVN